MGGVLEDLVSLLAEVSPCLVTYAGGASSLADLDRVSLLYPSPPSRGAEVRRDGGRVRYYFIKIF